MKRSHILTLTIAAVVLAFAFSATTFAGNTVTYCLCHFNNQDVGSWVKVKSDGSADFETCSDADGCVEDGVFDCDADGTALAAFHYHSGGRGSLSAHTAHGDEIFTLELALCTNSANNP